MELTIIIVNYKAKDMLRNSIQSIYENIEDLLYEIIVVDNNSRDGSCEMLQKEFPDVILIKNKYNAGFAKANNQAYSISKGKYIMLLNNDTVVLNNALKLLVSFLDENTDTAIVGPKLLNTDLTLQKPCRRGFPKFLNSMAYFLGLAKKFPQSRILAHYNMTYMDENTNHEVDAVSGAALVIRREDIRLAGGLLDETFFMHFEDIDLCYRVKKKGRKVFYIADAQIIHIKGQSSKLRSTGVVKNFYDSAFKYFKKNYKSKNIIGYYFIKTALLFMQKLSFTFIAYKGRDKK